jgi:hypothetical protein
MNDLTNSSDFDWVSARERCSMTTAFVTLKTQVKRDVNARNKNLGDRYEFRFDLTDNGDSFTVHTASERQIDTKTVTFERTGNTLNVRGTDGKTKFMAALTINSKGECRFKIDGEECDSWYVRKLALEDLFFWNS